MILSSQQTLECRRKWELIVWGQNSKAKVISHTINGLRTENTMISKHKQYSSGLSWESLNRSGRSSCQTSLECLLLSMITTWEARKLENSEEEEPLGSCASAHHGTMKLNTSDIKCKSLWKNLRTEAEQESISLHTLKVDSTSSLRTHSIIDRTHHFGLLTERMAPCIIGTMLLSQTMWPLCLGLKIELIWMLPFNSLFHQLLARHNKMLYISFSS